MKFWNALWFCLLSGVVSAGNTPQLSVGIHSGQSGTIAGLEPVLRWATSAKAGEYDLDGGITVKVKDMDEKPTYSLFGRVQRTIKGFRVSGRADLADAQLDSVDMDFRVEGEKSSIQLQGTAGSKYSVGRVQIKRAFDLKGGRLNFNPRFDIQKTEGDFTVGYSLNDVSFVVDASPKKQRFSLSRWFGDKTLVTPTVSLQGDTSLAVKQVLSDEASITATLTPKESANIRWEDGPWVANINAPMEGYLFEGAVDVSVKRKVEFL